MRQEFKGFCLVVGQRNDFLKLVNRQGRIFWYVMEQGDDYHRRIFFDVRGDV